MKTRKKNVNGKVEEDEIERCIAAVFNKKINQHDLEEKRQKIIDVPIDIKIKGENPTITTLERKGGSKSGNEGVTTDEVTIKSNGKPESDRKQEEKNKDSVELKEEPEIDNIKFADTPAVSKKSFRKYYVAGAMMAVLVAVAIFFIFRPAGELDRKKPSAKPVVHKIDRPPEKSATKKQLVKSESVVPVGELDRKKPSAKPVVHQTNRPPVKPATEKQPVKTVSVVPVGELDRDKPSGTLAAKQVSRSTEKPTGKPVPAVNEEAGSDDEIHHFLMEWKTAWENTAGKSGDIKAYMSFYSDDFVSQGMDKEDWSADKAQKNTRKEWIRLKLKHITIAKTAETDHAEVEFLQQYNSSNYSVDSLKTLILRREESGWKIIGIKSP